ncbi:hypothetical protein SD81_000915 [Tolypothrix campylonemoides VB511288]|nr:hypothetical protein SD81_000915 [Tolypothrix campylonemoides VB511288]
MEAPNILNISMQFFQVYHWVKIQMTSWIRNPKNLHPIVLIFIILNLTLTLPLAAILNIWIDEAWSLDTTSRDIVYAISHAINFEGQPPLYFALLNLWRSLNHSIFFARLFSVFCISLTIYTTVIVAQRYFKNIHPGWIAATVAFHPFTIWAALEIRLYAFGILISSLLLLFFFDGYLSDTPKTYAKWLYGLCSIIALYTNYLLACLLIGNALSLLLLRRWRAFYFYLLTMVIVGIFLLPMLLFLFFHVSRLNTLVADNPISLTLSVKHILKSLTNYALPISFTERKIYIRALFFLLAGFIIFFYIKYHHFITRFHAAVFCINFISTIVLTIVLFKMKILMERYLYPLFLITELSILSIFSLVPYFKRSKILTIWASIFLFFCLSSLLTIYKPLAKPGDYQQLVSYIMAHEKPNQTILAFPAYEVSPMSYYYSGINTIIPIPRPLEKEHFNLSGIVLKDEQEIITALSYVPGNHKYIWIISPFKLQGHNSNTAICKVLNVDLNCQVLENFINKYYSVKESREFYGMNVQLLYRNLE